MTIGILTFEIHIGDSRSLKDRRQVVRSLKERLRARHNVAVAEFEEHAELWQRAGIAVVSVASRRDPLDRLFDSIVREAEGHVNGSLIETGRDFLDAADGGAEPWSEERT